MSKPETQYFVLRTHSHTDSQQLWKVLSRPFRDKNDAEVWRQHEECLGNKKKYTYFIIQVEEVPDVRQC